MQLLDRDAVLDWQPGQGLLWLHFDINEGETKKWLHADEQLPQVVTAALLASETRPRANTIGDGVLLALRGVNLNPGANPVDMVSISLWIEADRIISTRRRRLLSVDDVVASLDEQPLTGPGDMVVRLVDRLVRRTRDVIESLDNHISILETDAAQLSHDLNRTDLANLRRDAIALRRYLAPQREALSQLHRGNFSWLTDDDKLNLREVSDRLILYLEGLDAFRERASVLQAELVSQLSEQLNRRMLPQLPVAIRVARANCISNAAAQTSSLHLAQLSPKYWGGRCARAAPPTFHASVVGRISNTLRN